MYTWDDVQVGAPETEPATVHRRADVETGVSLAYIIQRQFVEVGSVAQWHRQTALDDHVPLVVERDDGMVASRQVATSGLCSDVDQLQPLVFNGRIGMRQNGELNGILLMECN